MQHLMSQWPSGLNIKDKHQCRLLICRQALYIHPIYFLIPVLMMLRACVNRAYDFTKLSEIANYHQQKALHKRHYLTYLVNSRLDIIWGPLIDNIAIFPFHLLGCIHVIFMFNPHTYLILIVGGLSPSAVVFWYDANTLKQLFVLEFVKTSI